MKIANRLLQRTLGLRLTRNPPSRNDSFEDEIGLFRLLLERQMATRPIETIVQIGANDGLAHDPISWLLDCSSAKAVLVEPVPEAFERLTALRSSRPNTTLLQAAIADRDGEVEFWTARHQDPESEGQCSLYSSIDRGFVERMLKQYSPDASAVPVRVAAMTAATLCRNHLSGPIDLLQVDVEGRDAEVVHQFLDAGSQPMLIHYEHHHLSWEEDLRLLRRFIDTGYRRARIGIDTLAMRPDAAA